MNPGLLILLGLGAYLLYQSQQQGTTTTGTASTPTQPQTGGNPPGGRTPVNTTTSQTSVATPPTVTPYTGPPTAQAYSKLLAVVKAAGVQMSGGDYLATPWQFNYYLNQAIGVDVFTESGDVGTIFPGCGTGGPCDNTPMSLSQFWYAVSSWIQSHGATSTAPAAGTVSRTVSRTSTRPALLGLGVRPFVWPRHMSGGWK